MYYAASTTGVQRYDNNLLLILPRETFAVRPVWALELQRKHYGMNILTIFI